jgi:hypothetical protein
VAIVAVTYFISSALFVDGLPLHEEHTAVVSLDVGDSKLESAAGQHPAKTDADKKAVVKKGAGTTAKKKRAKEGHAAEKPPDAATMGMMGKSVEEKYARAATSKYLGQLGHHGHLNKVEQTEKAAGLHAIREAQRLERIISQGETGRIVKQSQHETKHLMESNDDSSSETAAQRLARHAAFAAEQGVGQSVLLDSVALIQANGNGDDAVQDATTTGAAQVVEKARTYVKTAKKMAAEGAAAVGAAEAQALQKITDRKKHVSIEAGQLKVASQQEAATVRRERLALQAKQRQLDAQAKAQREIFEVQSANAKRLAADVTQASALGKIRKGKEQLAKERASLDAQSSLMKKIYQSQQQHHDQLQQQVAVISRAEKSELSNAERLGEAKAHAMDQAQHLTNTRVQKAQAEAALRSQKWTRHTTAALGKVLVISQALAAQVSKKNALITAAKQKLSVLRNNVLKVRKGLRSLERDDHSIREGTEELSREELGQGDSQSEDLGESEELSNDDDGLTAELQGMSNQLEAVRRGDDLGEGQGLPGLEEKPSVQPQAKASKAALHNDGSLGVDLAKMSASFDDIQHQIQEASSEEVHVEHLAAHAKRTKERRLEEAASTKSQSKVAAHQPRTESKNEQSLEKKLADEEARLRSTTAARIKAQYKVQNAVNDERSQKAKVAKKSSVHATTALTPEMATRLEYQRMYLAQKQQQALQKRTDLENQLAELREKDANHLKLLTDDIRTKRAVLKHDLNSLSTLSSEYERDHELGDSLSDGEGVAALAAQETRQEKQDLKLDSQTAEQASVVIQQLADDHKVKEAALLLSAKKVLHKAPPHMDQAESGQTDVAASPDSTAETKLAARLAEAKMALRLKVSQFESMRKEELKLNAEASQLRTAAKRSKDRESEAAERTDAMTEIAQHLNAGIETHEEKMELSETLFTKDKKMEEGSEELGESEDTSTPLPPIQAELNAEQEQMEAADSQLKAIADDTPKLLKQQVAFDKKELGKRLRMENAKLNALHKHFEHAAESLSPTLKSQNALDSAVRDEERIQDRFTTRLHSIASYADMVNAKAKEAEAETSNVV